MNIFGALPNMVKKNKSPRKNCEIIVKTNTILVIKTHKYTCTNIALWVFMKNSALYSNVFVHSQVKWPKCSYMS